MKMLRTCLLLGAVVLDSVAAPNTPSSGQSLSLPAQIHGRVRVVDGKTLTFMQQKETVRLAGYETPEPEQIADSDGVEWPAGQIARSWLVLRTLRRDVNCSPLQRDGNNVILAHCFVGEINLAAAAIAEGIGYAYHYPGEPAVPAYFDLERRARGLGFGVWSAKGLLPPWQYRAEKSKPALAPSNIDPPGQGPARPLPLSAPAPAGQLP